MQQARVAARRDSLGAAFQKGRRLRWREVWALKRDRNAEQIAIAQRMGVRASDSTEIAALVRQGRLVPLQDSTDLWVLREMDYSVPYVTPDTRALLVRIGRSFHARLDSLGLPHYRMKLTSGLRTAENQVALRRVNANASQTVSAHEFGTTVDISHAGFAAPDSLPAGAWPELELPMLDSVGKGHTTVLQAALGRALLALKEQGLLVVMMENGQPVYHLTVARPLAERG